MTDPLTTLAATALAAAVALLLFWPEVGLVPWWRRMRRAGNRILIEDAVKHIHECESGEVPPTVASVAGALHTTAGEAAELLAQLSGRGLARLEGEHIRLTPDGRDYALHVIRAHRLWERYLADETGFAETEWHALAERREHTLSRAEVGELSAKLGHPTHDPHGDPIPTAEGEIVGHGGQPLTTLEVDTPLRIVHLEDEPEAVYAQLVAEGLRPGMVGRATEISEHRVRLWAEGDDHVLAPVVAANVYAVPLPEEEAVEIAPTERLSALRPGEKGTVVGVSRACPTPDRRRLFDLGLVPGTVVEAYFRSPSGDPTAYCIRGAVIALRHDQAGLIQIVRPEETTA